MKVFVLSNFADGLYLFRKEVLMAFMENGYETVVLVPKDENWEKIEKLGCRMIPVELERRGSNPFHDFSLLLRYYRILAKEKPDLVLTYTIKPNLYGGLSCSLLKIPYLMNITGLGTALQNPGMLGKFLLRFYKIACSKASCVFFQNESNRRFMQERGIAVANSRMLPGSGINLKEHPIMPYPDEKDGIIFLAVIRIMKDKGIEEYLEAAKRVKQESPDTKFYLVGEYEQESRAIYEPLIEKMTELGVIRYFGYVDNVQEIMAKSHVIVHPSYHEGLSNVLLEAAACARVVLASDIPGCRETFLPEQSGIAFTPKDADSIVNAIRTVLGYRESDRRQMGLRGREYVESIFDRKKVIDIYLDEIKRATTQKGVNICRGNML